MPVITVSQINRYIASKIKSDKILQGIMVKGEISNYVCHYKSGHIYFSLKDSESTIKAVMFSSAASRLKFEIEDGMQVVVSGSVSVFERDGVYQLYANDIIPDGAGKASLALEQLKKKLASEGIFSEEHKRSVPSMPKKIGAVTSLSGAAVRDIINVLSRRYPLCEVYAVNAVVQGAEAPASICKGIFKAEQACCDVIIVGRGGGSSEDLSAFNDESVVRAIFNCNVPVISAVGHETDISLSDMAADLRAPTPSAAAELASPDINRLYDIIETRENRILSLTEAVIEKRYLDYNALSASLLSFSPENRVALLSEKCDNLKTRAEIAVKRYLDKGTSLFTEQVTKLEGLSPLKIMARGYSLIYDGDNLVRNSSDLRVGQKVSMQFDNGGAEADITKLW